VNASEHGNVVAGDKMGRSVDDFVGACEVMILALQLEAAPDNALIDLLCDAVRFVRERALGAENRTPIDLKEIEAFCATFCAHCGKRELAYPSARFCGAACSHREESHEALPQLGKLRAVCLGLVAEVRRVLTLQHEAEWKLDRVAQELKAELQTTQGLRATLATVKTRIDNVWMWQGDGGNYARTLSCPVIMEAETAYAMEQRAEKAEALAAAATVFTFGKYSARDKGGDDSWIVCEYDTAIEREAPNEWLWTKGAAIAEAKRLAGVTS
jgi:hypothetical protein